MGCCKPCGSCWQDGWEEAHESLGAFDDDTDNAFTRGAAVAFGLVGMAEAIRVNHIRNELGQTLLDIQESYDRYAKSFDDLSETITRDLAAQADQWAVFKRLRELGILTEEQYRKLLLMA